MKIHHLTRDDLPSLPIRKEACFSNHKEEFKKKIMERQTKILKRFYPFLKPLLEPGEEILLSVEATSPMSFFEQWTMSWLVYYLKRCVLIFTNKRILHFPTKHNFAPKYSLSQIRCGDIEEYKLNGFLGRVLEIKCKSGKKEKFYNIKSGEFRKLKTLNHLFVKDQLSQVGERHFLCPRCRAPLLKNIFSCPNCHLAFKNMRDAIRLSLLFPGGGYFYTGHTFLGVMDAITEGILLLALITHLMRAFNGTDSWGLVLLFGILLLYEKFITIYHAKQYIGEYIPNEKNFGLFPLNPSAGTFPSVQPSPGPEQRKGFKTTLAVVLLIFSVSFLTWKLYPYLAH